MALKLPFFLRESELQSARERLYGIFLWLQSQSILQAVGYVPQSSACDPSCPCGMAWEIPSQSGHLFRAGAGAAEIPLPQEGPESHSLSAPVRGCQDVMQPFVEPLFKAEIGTIGSVLSALVGRYGFKVSEKMRRPNEERRCAQPQPLLNTRADQRCG